jgi:hypothetical protein
MEHKHEALNRFAFAKSEKEAWLQDALNSCPEILPVSELDSSFAPLVSLGREILNIDNLFVSPSGRITLVETKLWRNPESTRAAISQIIDYAHKLRNLSYEDLQEKAQAAKDSTLPSGWTIHQLVAETFPNETEDEAEFIDSVNRTLSTARFMLIVAGDGIRENLEGMVDLLQTQPQMLFTFGLVELQVYEHKPSKGKLIVPQIVAHSTEIVRAVVKVQTEGKAVVSVTMPPEGIDKGTGKKRGTELTHMEFYDQIANAATRESWRSIVKGATDMGLSLQFASKSASLCVGSMHLFRLTTAGKAFPYGRYPPEAKEVRAVIGGMVSDLGKLYGIPLKKGKSGMDALVTRPVAKDVLGKETELLEILRRTLEKINTLG